MKEQEILHKAARILERKAKKSSSRTFYDMSSAEKAKKYCSFILTDHRDEKFHVIALNTKHEVLDSTSMFVGTIDNCPVFVRSVIRYALELNAAALIFAHNHPNGNSEPSEADIAITRRLKKACDLFEIRILDHIIVGISDQSSMRETTGALDG